VVFDINGNDMSRKICKRKHYVTNGFNAVQHAIDGALVVDQKSLNALLLRDLSSLESIMMGQGTKQEWYDLTATLNLCETMARRGIGPEALHDCLLAQKALKKVALQYQNDKAMIFSKTELKAIRNMIDYHNLQRQCISRSEYEKFIQIVLNRVKNKTFEVEYI